MPEDSQGSAGRWAGCRGRFSLDFTAFFLPAVQFLGWGERGCASWGEQPAALSLGIPQGFQLPAIRALEQPAEGCRAAGAGSSAARQHGKAPGAAGSALHPGGVIPGMLRERCGRWRWAEGCDGSSVPGRWFILFSASLPQQLGQGRLERAARLSPSCASLGTRFHRALPSIPNSIPRAQGTDSPRGFSKAHSKGVQRGVMDGSDRAQTPEGGNKTGRDSEAAQGIRADREWFPRHSKVREPTLRRGSILHIPFLTGGGG